MAKRTECLCVCVGGVCGGYVCVCVCAWIPEMMRLSVWLTMKKLQQTHTPCACRMDISSLSKMSLMSGMAEMRVGRVT